MGGFGLAKLDKVKPPKPPKPPKKPKKRKKKLKLALKKGISLECDKVNIMADDVEITAGSGTIIKTDQVGTDHVQYMKLMDGTADGSGVIPGDAANGLDVDVTRLGRSFTKTSATGSGAITASQAISADARLTSVTLHFDAAPGTSEAFTITIDANDGAAYDVVLASVNPANEGLTDYVYIPDGDLFLENGDAIDLAFTNTDGDTYGVQITSESV